MSAYLLSIIGIVLLTAILSAVLPDGKTVKFIKGIAKLCCLAVILAPVLGFFKEASDGKINFPFFSSETVIETDGAFIDYCSTKRIENAETELEKKLEETFSASGSRFCGNIAVRSRRARRTGICPFTRERKSKLPKCWSKTRKEISTGRYGNA